MCQDHLALGLVVGGGVFGLGAVRSLCSPSPNKAPLNQEDPWDAAGRRARCPRAARRTTSTHSKLTPRPGPGSSSQGRCSAAAAGATGWTTPTARAR
eukprot:266595-Rhodomonas_salina.1